MDKIIDKIVDAQREKDSRTPLHPDPLWPEKALPLHLSAEQKAKAVEIGAYVALKESDWKCENCDTTERPSKEKPHLCVHCAILDDKQTNLAKKTNSTWMELAKEYGLEYFERQPEESDTDWRIWEAYRSYYPLKLPTYSELAEKTGYASGTVVNAAQRWSYKIRIMAWARFCDAGIQTERVEAVREMNTKQQDMSGRLLKKLSEAIDIIDPKTLRPGEIVNLFKVATDLERKIVTMTEEKVNQPAIVENDTRTHTLTKPEDIATIAAILRGAGVFEGREVTVETATRVLVKGEDS